MIDSEGTATADHPTTEITADAISAPATAATPPPIDRRDAWINFAYLSLWSYLLYGLGNATPYLKSSMGLSDFEAGLHGSALAVGVLIAGMGLDRFARRFGSRWLIDLGVGAIIVGVAAISLATALPLSLVGAVVLGLAGGTIGTQVNVNLSRSDAVTSRRLITQANALSMVTAAAAPLALSVAVGIAGAWQIALLLPVVAGLALSAARPRQGRAQSQGRLPRGHLPGAFWFTWIFLVISVSIEFSFVFWGSTIVIRQAGVSQAEGTSLASLFVIGMLVGRTALSRGLGIRRDPRLILSLGLLTVLTGAVIVRVSGLPALSGAGLFLGGAGTAGLFPIGMALALDRAGRAKFEAATRGTLAGGMAVLLAPSVLGLASDAVGVSSGWLIVPGLAVAAMLVLAVTPHADG